MTERTESPQIEDGYTKIANELLEAMANFPFTSRQYSVLLAIIRKTYGFNKKTDDIGLSQIEKLTGIDKANLSRTIRDLADRRVLIRSQGTFGHKLSINKHYSQWGLPKQQPLSRVAKTTTPPVVDSTTPPVAKTTTTKDNPSKDNQPKEKNLLSKQVWTSESFDQFWSAWPVKTAKKKAADAFRKIAPNDELLQTILLAVEQQKNSAGWIEAGGRFIPMAATWLNGCRWEDEVAPAVGSFSSEQQAFIDQFNANIGPCCQPVTEWSQRIADLINLASAGKWTDERWVKYWTYVRTKCTFRGQMSFEWLASRDNLVKVIRGDFEVAE